MQATRQAANAGTLLAKPLITDRQFGLILVLDCALYLSLFWRDYQDHSQMLIAHYLSFVAITDLGALFLPRNRRHWYNLFRVTSGLSFMVLVVALALKGLDGESLALTLLRCCLILGRILHGGFYVYRCGPWVSDLTALPAYVSAYFRNGNASERLGCWYLAVGLALLYFPHLAYWTHYNWGDGRLDDVLTGLQAQAGLNFCIKLFIFEVMVLKAGSKLMMRSVVALLFVAQWPLMPGMFYLAPLPVMHAAVELYEIALVIVGYRYWRQLAQRDEVAG